jgi:chloride channel protein, CIC family
MANDLSSPSSGAPTPRSGFTWTGRAIGFGQLRAFRHWIIYAVLIGIVAGLGAIAFFWLIEVVTQLFLGQLVGYLPPAPTGEGNRLPSAMGRPWVLPLVVALGGLLSGLLVFLLAPEAEGHGTDAAIEAFHEKGGRIRARIPPIKLIASAITIGSGGSAGREGPTAQISAGFGSRHWRHLPRPAGWGGARG